ncbi:MAG: NAD(P)H-dependent glycerol-3-phosphate dehydrogenase [Acidimicrobiia bacterium]
MKITVVGAGSWGTTVASMLAPKVDTVLWARRPELAEHLNEGTNPDYLPGFDLPSELSATTDIEVAVAGADAIVMSVPSHGFRAVLEQASSAVDPETPILSLSKGIEQSSLMRMTEVASDVLRNHNHSRIGVLTGPNLAREIMAGQPAATVIAMTGHDAATDLQAVFMGPRFRVYTNPDVVGAESAGALKNVMAIAAGMAEGLGFGLNTVSMLMTRALVEMSRLGVAMGGRPSTFAGLAGMGDLIATCMSSESRNHRVGLGLGQGKTIDEIVSDMNMVAEGVKSTKGILALADQHSIEMPIAEQVGRVLYDNASVPEAIATLMGRSAKPE